MERGWESKQENVLPLETAWNEGWFYGRVLKVPQLPLSQSWTFSQVYLPPTAGCLSHLGAYSSPGSRDRASILLGGAQAFSTTTAK